MVRIVAYISPFLLLFAFTLELQGQKLPIRSYSIEQGLSESVAYSILQDRDGYIWIGTGFGLNRLDGREILSYYTDQGLNDNQINTLYEDDEGRLWIGTDAGVNVMESGEIREEERYRDLRQYAIQSIYHDSKGNWWFGTAGDGIWLFTDDDECVRFSSADGLAGNVVRAVGEDSEGRIWMATNRGLAVYDGEFATWSVEDGLVDNEIHDLQAGSDGRIWLATNGGLSIWDGESFNNYQELDGLIDDHVLSVHLIGENRAWLGTDQGASLFEDGRFTEITTEQGLTSDIIYSIMTDREGQIWFGTLGGGGNIFLGDYFHNYTVDEGLTNNVITSFAQDRNGAIWISSYGGGIMQYDGEEFIRYFTADGLADRKVYTLYFDSREHLWIGTRYGISLMVDGEFQSLPEYLPDLEMVRRFFEDPENGDFWIATYDDGIYRYDGEELHHYTAGSELNNNTVMAMERDSSGRYWFATYGGVAVYENGEFRNYTVADGLPNNGVIHVMLDQEETPWFSTFGGIARYVDGEIETFESSFGYAGTISYFMFQDSRERHWIGTNIGIVRFDPERYQEAESRLERDLSFELVNREQGLVANEVNAGAVFEDRDETVWMGTVEGISRFFPDRFDLREVPPVTRFREIIFAGEQVGAEEKIVRSHDRNFVQFEMSGISFAAPSQVLFEYRLRGLDEEWTRTFDRNVRYPSLSPGEYTFQMRSYNASGIASPVYSTFDFEIRPPVWLQWWFLLLVVLLMGGIILFIYNYYRVSRQIDMERMRVQIASDLHDDVGSSLTELALQTDFARTGKLDPSVETTLKEIGEQSRMIVSTLDDIVWSIDARNDTAGDLSDRMQDHASNVLSSKGVEVNFNLSELPSERELPVQVKENLYLIFKEAINNIVRHSNADSVDIQLSLNGNRYFLNVRDNGTVAVNGRKSGQGLRNIRLRADRLDAILKIDKGDGFSIRVEGEIK